jgi:NADH-quinone oxidoreductase subunit N
MTGETILYVLPELILALVATGIYVVGAFVGPKVPWAWVGAAGVIAAGAALFGIHPEGATGALAGDALSVYLRQLALAVGLLFVLLSSRDTEGRRATPEHVGTLLLAVVGLMLTAGASDLVLLFLGLELISIPTYVLLYTGRRDAASQESAAKYFFLSILSSAILLYGFSFLYGAAGSTDLRLIRAELTGQAATDGIIGPVMVLAVVLIFAGLGFKIAAAPFHFYAPDVYQGTTHANAGLLAVLPKIAGLAALVRLIVIAMPGADSVGWRVAVVLAVMTMTIGNLLALWQDNLRRLLAYSSIAHAGYLLIGLAVALAAMHDEARPKQLDGVGAVLFYLVVYALATTGAFAALTWISGGDRRAERLDDLAGVGRTDPLAGLALAVCMFSLAGVPPLAGFWGKLTIFGGALAVDASGESLGRVQAWFIGLAVIGVLNAAVAAAYYLRVVAALYFRLPSRTGQPSLAAGRGAWAAMVLATVAVIGVGVYPGWLVESSNLASQAARSRPGSPDAAEAQATASEPLVNR